MTHPVIGVVCALRDEAQTLAAGPWHWRAIRTLGDHAVCWSGPGATAASQAAEQLIAAGCQRLVSWGVCGGLDLALPSGALVIPDAVVADDEHLPVDVAWAQALRGAEDHAGLIADSTAVLTSVAAKSALFSTCAAAAVDMESAAVLRVAVAAGLPAVVVRAIADDASSALPPAVCRSIGANGQPRLAALLTALALHPSEWVALGPTRRRFHAALASLRAKAPQLLAAQA